jgi:hypothetical protein
MSVESSEQIRTIITLLENLAVTEKEKKSGKKDQDDDAEDIDSVLVKPAGLEKLVGNINLKALIDLLELPKAMQGQFRSGINALKADDPKLTTQQAMAIATAFDHMLTRFGKQKTKLATLLKPVTPPNA